MNIKQNRPQICGAASYCKHPQKESQILEIHMGNDLIRKRCIILHCAKLSLDYLCYIGIEFSKLSFRPSKVLICNGT